MSITDNILKVREGIVSACAAAGRNEDEITLVAVSKTRTAEEINQAVAAGAVNIGENYVQELLGKIDGIDPAAALHFIGHLQSNKAKQLVGRVELIQSVDRLSLAQEISRQAERRGVCQRILLEINAGEEQGKAGISFDAAMELAHQLAELPHLKLCGVMSIPPHLEESTKIQPFFERLYHLFLDIAHKKIDNTDICILSMGMSGDYREAIACGSNMVRVGTAIFGPRPPKV